MSELQRVKELLNAFGVEIEAEHEKILTVGLLLGYNAASALDAAMNMRVSHSHAEAIDIIFKDRMEKRIKFTPPILSTPLTAQHLEQILKFHKLNLNLLGAL